ncbi:MAG TPA: YgcG family protein [Rhodocyclaceae bacterium]|nr:YgcG family protein [Rhodocyclaceae bacterium]
MTARRLGAFLVLFWLWLAGAAWAEVAVPALKARVTDLTGTLSAEQLGSLENQLKEIEGKNGSQMAVLLVPTTQPETIEQYSIRVAEAWKLGKKDVDNGVLVLVAKNDRKVRIEVGYGLEGAIPDASAKRVIAEDISPRFKAGDFAGGLQAGIKQLAGLVDAETGTAEQPSYSCAAPDDSPPIQDAPAAAQPPADLTFGDRVAGYLRDMPVWIIVVLVIVGTLIRCAIGPFFGGLTMGSVVGAGAWFAWGTVEAALFGGIVAFIFVLVGLENWISMAFEGSSGSGSSGGSFSGGGGSFGGGGASGSW